MDLTADELASETASWENHPFTHRTIKLFEGRLEASLHELKTACSATSDPKVAAAYGRMVAIAEHVAYYKQRRSPRA